MKPYLKSHLSITFATVSRVLLTRWSLVAGGTALLLGSGTLWSWVCKGSRAAPGPGQGTDLVLPCVTSSGEMPQMKRFCERSPEV